MTPCPAGNNFSEKFPWLLPFCYHVVDILKTKDQPASTAMPGADARGTGDMVRLPNEMENGPKDKAAERLRQFEEARRAVDKDAGQPADAPENGRKQPAGPEKEGPQPPPPGKGRGEEDPDSR